MTIRITLMAAACALSLAACGDRTPPPDTNTTAPAATPADTTAPVGTTTPADTTPPADTTAGTTGGTPSAPTAPADTMAPANTTAGTTGGAPAATTAPAGTTAPANTTGQATGTTTAAASAAGADKPAAVVSNCATEIEGNDAIQYNVGSIVVPASCSKFTITLRHVGKLPVAAMGHNVVIARTADVQAVVADGLTAGAAANYVKAGDARIIANTQMIGGGQSTSVTFDASKLKAGGPYTFFCSFPGHVVTMKGTIGIG